MPHATFPSSQRRDGFTLIEVMLSLAIALILLYGMQRVFTETAGAINAGQAIGEATRNGRAVQPVLFNDLNSCATDSPAFIISSSLTPQYLNATDAKTGSLALTTGCIPTDHLHRTDMLMFFARGLFKRKTADQNYLVSTTTSDEAYIHLGHLNVSTDGINYLGPENFSTSTGPFASEWVLGRNAMLLNDRVNVLPNAKDLGNVPEVYYPNPNYPPSNASSFTPLNPTAANIPAAMSPFTQFQQARYDLAGLTLDQFRANVTSAAYGQASQAYTAMPYYTWWAPLIYYQKAFTTAAAPILPYPPVVVPAGTYPAFTKNRVQGSNVLSNQPLSGQDQANLASYMLEHVSQFIVEYAGDFVSQDVNGNITDTTPDGQIDWVYATKGDYDSNYSYSTGDYVFSSPSYYVATAPSTGSAPPGATWVVATPPKQIRWYGMPRDTSGSGHVYAYGIGAKSANEMNNVVPLVDIWKKAAANSTRPLPYEVELPPQPAASPFDYAASTNGMNPATRYTAVWRNDVPAMVRILLKLDDPSGLLQDGPWFEYVFKLK